MTVISTERHNIRKSHNILERARARARARARTRPRPRVRARASARARARARASASMRGTMVPPARHPEQGGGGRRR